MSAKKIRLAESLIIIYDTIIYMKYNKEMNHIIIVAFFFLLSVNFLSESIIMMPKADIMIIEYCHRFVLKFKSE